jgi:transcriptional regulator with XRE-family HTH domain
MINFCDRLFQLKTNKNLLQKDIARGINISLRSYQRYETGEREPSLSTLIALSDYFNVSIDYLAGRTDNPEINQ